MNIEIEQIEQNILRKDWWGELPPPTRYENNAHVFTNVNFTGREMNTNKDAISHVEDIPIKELKLENCASGAIWLENENTFKVPSHLSCEPFPTTRLSSTGYTTINTPPEVATKYDEGKIDYSIMPLDSLEEVAKVFMFGAKKYEGWNFANGNGMAWTRVWKSLMRHAFAWIRGEDNDPESGFSHLAHAGCCIFMLLHYVKNPKRYDQDDRYKY